MGVKLWINKGHIYLSLCYNKKVWRESTGLSISSDRLQNKEVMKLAEIMRSKRELQIATERTGMSYELCKDTLYDYAVKYITEKHHEKTDGKALPYLERFGGKDILISAVNASWYESFQNKMEALDLSKFTTEKYCGVIRTIFKKALRDGIITKDPAKEIKRIKVPESEREFLTADELQKMISTPFYTKTMDRNRQDEIRYAFLFGCFTGLRISDLLQLRYRMIDTKEMRISKFTQKGQKAVYIPLKKEVLELLGDISDKNPDELVFPLLSSGGEIKYSRYLQPWADAAGVHKHVTMHVSRHTDATLLLESGADLYTVQKLLGHSRIQTTAIYAKVSDRMKTEAVENLPDFDLSTLK